MTNFEEQAKRRLADAVSVMQNLRKRAQELVAARREQPPRLEALIALLIQKGIITEDQLAQMSAELDKAKR